MNVARLKAFKSKLIVFPRKAGKPKSGDSEVNLVGPSTMVPPRFSSHGFDNMLTMLPISSHRRLLPWLTLLSSRVLFSLSSRCTSLSSPVPSPLRRRTPLLSPPSARPAPMLVLRVSGKSAPRPKLKRRPTKLERNKLIAVRVTHENTIFNNHSAQSLVARSFLVVAILSTCVCLWTFNHRSTRQHF